MVVLSGEAEAQRMPSAERMSAAAANARAAETKEKVKRLFHPQSVDLWRHLKLLRFDKIGVSKVRKRKPRFSMRMILEPIS